MTARALPDELVSYQWPPSTAELAATAGLSEHDVLRFDGNVAPAPNRAARPAAVARALSEVNEYDRGRYEPLRRAIADRHNVDVAQVVLGAGSDELIVLCARTFAANGTVAQVPAVSYSMYKFAAGMAGAKMIDDPSVADLVFVCRPNNPTGELVDVPRVTGQLVIDEAYAEYADVDALHLVDDGAIVLRTFSKVFGLAGARVGYAICDERRAAILNSRLAPLSVSSLSAALALTALRTTPDVTGQLAERARLREELAELGLVALESHTNFLYIPLEDPTYWYEALLAHGVVVRTYPGAIRISVRDRDDDDVLIDAVRAVRGVAKPEAAMVRHRRVTAETRIAARLRTAGQGRVFVDTDNGLYDHLLTQLAFHAGWDLTLTGVGDLETGEHHTFEDAMRTLGETLDVALGDRRGIARYGESRIPMDEAVGHAVVDVSGRPVHQITIDPDPGTAAHGLESLAQAARLTLHVAATGVDAHHTAEVAYKAVGRALAAALAVDGGEVRSTKGSL